MKFLNADGAVATFKNRQDSQVTDSQDKTPPLVKQAQTLESILNPRVQVTAQTPATKITGGGTPVVGPPKSTAKFDLVGVSYLSSDPGNSFAYIRLPDNSYQWVRQGSDVGHLTIQQIKNDSIICSDGRELKVEPTVDTASILEVGAAVAQPAVGGLFQGVVQPAIRPGGRVPLSDRITGGSSPASAGLSKEDEAGLSELVHRLKELKGAKADQADANAASGEKAAEVGKLISEIKSSRVGAEEARNLDKLGEQLNGAKDDAAKGNPTKDSPTEEKRREPMRRMGQPRTSKP
jgi:hypothetical protein